MDFSFIALQVSNRAEIFIVAEWPRALNPTRSAENRQMSSSPPGQKTSLTQETELLESLLQEVEHQVRSGRMLLCVLAMLSCVGPFGAS